MAEDALQGDPLMRVAAIRLTSTAGRSRNMETAAKLLAVAAGDGTRLIVLPEMLNVLGDAEVLRAGAEPLDEPSFRWAGEQARRHGVSRPIRWVPARRNGIGLAGR